MIIRSLQATQPSVSPDVATTNLLDFFEAGGYIMYPLALCGIIILVLAGRATWRITRSEARSGSLERATIDGILFWGGYALVLGVLGTVVGIAVAARAVELAGEVSAPMIWGGIKVSLIPTLYGLLTLLTSALLWFGLRHWHRKTVLSGG